MTADFDRDGVLDIITANEISDAINVLRGVGDGTFETRQRVLVGFDPYGIAVGDLNGDGALDIAGTDRYANSVGVLLNRCLPCPADVTYDGSIDLADLNLVLANFGQATGDGDATGDGEVDLADLNLVLGAFGVGCG